MQIGLHADAQVLLKYITNYSFCTPAEVADYSKEVFRAFHFYY